MSYNFKGNVSYGRVRRYATQVIGGLEARPQTQGLAPPFRKIRDAITAARTEREAADDLVLIATARLRVEDSDWDLALGKVSARAYELAGKVAQNDPYATLFGKVDARRAKSLGSAKAVAVGQTVVRDGRRLADDGAPELSQPLEDLGSATARLLDARARFDEADDALFAPRRAKKKLLAELNQLIAITEAGILGAFPGRSDIVGAILLPWFERRRAAKSVDDADPDAPDIDDESDDDGDAPGGEVTPS